MASFEDVNQILVEEQFILVHQLFVSVCVHGYFEYANQVLKEYYLKYVH